MAGFCGKCGRPLQDGEVCNCQGARPAQQFGGAAPRPNGYQPNGYQGQAGGYGAQQGGYTPPQNGYYGQPGGYPGGAPNQSGQTVNQAKNAVKEVVPLVKSPFTKTQEIARSGDLAIGIGGIAVELVMALLMVFVSRGRMINNLASVMKSAYGVFSNTVSKSDCKEWVADFFDELGFSIGRLLLVTIVVTVGIALLRALLLKVFTKNVFKGQTSFAEMLTISGVRGLFAAAILLVATLLALVSFNAALIVMLVGFAAIVGVSPILYAGTARLDNNKKVYTYLIVAAILAVVVLIVVGIFWVSLGENMLDIVGDLEDLLNGIF